MASSYPDRNGKDRTKYTRNNAKRIAGSKTYTATGEPIRNLSAYVSAGGRPNNSRGDLIRNPTAYQNSIEASVRQNTNDPKCLYHYTTQEAAASISESGTIQTSTTGLAGPGAYCTAKPPRCSTEALLSNNYSHAAARNPSYVENYVRMDADSLNAQYVGGGSRDVWKVDGEVDVDQHDAFVAERGRNFYDDDEQDSGQHERHGNCYDGDRDRGNDCYHDLDAQDLLDFKWGAANFQK